MTIFSTTLKRIAKQPLNALAILLFPIIFLVPISITSGVSEDSAYEANLFFAVADRDNTVLSGMLIKRLGMRYNVVHIAEEDVSAKLTNQDVPWALVIREGYERNLLAGKEPVLESYSLTVSDVSSLGTATAANITRALMLLGTNDEQVLSAWEEASDVTVETLETSLNWGEISFWFGFYGFVAIYTAYSVIRTLMDNKRGGMPDRMGALPQSARTQLAQGMLAAFAATEITVVLMLVDVMLVLGFIPNAQYLFLLLSLYNLFTVGMVFAVFSLAKNATAVSLAVTALSVLISMLGGLFWPLELVPDFMQKLAWFSPGYWLSHGLASIHQISFSGYVLPALFLLGFTLLALSLGGWKHTNLMES